MANIAYFEIPADKVDRAKHFYHSLLGWKIEPTKTPMDQSKVLRCNTRISAPEMQRKAR